MGALFEAKPVLTSQSDKAISGFVRVEHTPEFVDIFDYLFSCQSQALYNHSKIFPFSYLNKGNLQLYLNSDFSQERILPVIKKFTTNPSYNIYCPHASYVEVIELASKLDDISAHPVEIVDVTEAYANSFLGTTIGWTKRKTMDDVIQDAAKIVGLHGRNYSSIRNTLKHVRVDLKPDVKPLSNVTYQDAISVFEHWKEVQGKKYFRVTVGRDIRLITEYYDKVDFTNHFGYVYYVNGVASAVSYGCRHSGLPEWGIDVTVKADIHQKGLGDFAFHHLVSEMYARGILFINDSGYYSSGVKLNKVKWAGSAPVRTIPVWNLCRTKGKEGLVCERKAS